MAKAGARSRVGQPAGTGRTPQRLVEAAIAALREEGFAGASARAIAGRAGCNQGLVFYHFGTVANLLLAALDETSRRRMERYEPQVEAAADISALMSVAAAIYREDLDAGHMTVLAEMIAGASSTPGLASEVAARIEPWVDFTEDTVRRAMGANPLVQLLPAREVAFAAVAMYLGIEMLSHLSNDRAPAEALLATATRLASVVATFAGAGAGAEAGAGAGAGAEAGEGAP